MTPFYDTFFILAAIFLGLSYAFITWQLAIVKRRLVVIMLPLFMFSFYALGKEVYNHFGAPTIAYPQNEELVMWHWTDPINGTTYLVSMDITQNNSVPVFRAITLSEETKEELRKKQQGVEAHGGVIGIVPTNNGIDFEESTIGHLRQSENVKY